MLLWMELRKAQKQKLRRVKNPFLEFHPLQETPFMSTLTLYTIRRTPRSASLLPIPYTSDLCVAHFL
jgi:hypothetical protein